MSFFKFDKQIFSIFYVSHTIDATAITNCIVYSFCFCTLYAFIKMDKKKGINFTKI